MSQNSLLEQIKDGHQFPPSVYEDNDRIYLAMIGLQVVVFVATAIAFSFWIYRSHRNLKSLGALALEYTPGWAVGWYFVPIASWVVPYLVMQEIWKNSDPDRIGKFSKATSLIVVVWWILFVIRVILGSGLNVAFPSSDHPSIETLITATSFQMAWYAIGAAAAAAAIVVILKIDANQQERYNRLHADPATQFLIP